MAEKGVLAGMDISDVTTLTRDKLKELVMGVRQIVVTSW